MEINIPFERPTFSGVLGRRRQPDYPESSGFPLIVTGFCVFIKAFNGAHLPPSGALFSWKQSIEYLRSSR